MGYPVFTEQCKERQSKAKGLMKLVVYPDDLLYKCVEEYSGNTVKITKYFPDGHVEYETKQAEDLQT